MAYAFTPAVLAALAGVIGSAGFDAGKTILTQPPPPPCVEVASPGAAVACAVEVERGRAIPAGSSPQDGGDDAYR